MKPLLLVSDVHFGAEDRAALAALERAVTEIDPSAILVAGDLTLSGRRHEFRAAASWLRKLGRPIALTPGNHDVPVWRVLERFIAPLHGFGKVVAPAGMQEMQTEDARIVSVSTVRGVQMRWNWAHGVISTDQARIVSAKFADAPPEILRLVLCHHPLITPPGAPIETSTAGGGDAASIFTQAGVDAVLTGHLHKPFVQPFPFGDGMTWSIGAGTMSMRQRGVPPSFTTLQVVEAQLEATAWRIEDGKAVAEQPALLPLRPRA